jgi:cell division protein FtsZ
VEFNFTVNEPIVEPKSDFGQPKNEFEAFTQTVEEVAPKIENFYQPKEEIKVEEKPVFQNRAEVETPRQTESEFTFVNKPADQERVVERRNKLKEFNSRYQNFDNANEFESVPAFKRKNISIDGSNASDQNINSYLSDNNGNMQIRENRFLNKDVD